MLKTVAFFGTCSASSTLVLVSPRISRPYRVREIIPTFTPGSENMVKLRFYVSGDDHAPSSGAPSGVSMLMDYGQVDYVVGSDMLKVLKHDLDVREGGSFLKVYADNSDTSAHAVECQMIIEIEE